MERIRVFLHYLSFVSRHNNKGFPQKVLIFIWVTVTFCFIKKRTKRPLWVFEMAYLNDSKFRTDTRAVWKVRRHGLFSLFLVYFSYKFDILQ